MANLTDPRIVNWADNRARTLADQGEAWYAIIAAYVGDYAAQGIVALINAGGVANLVADQSVVGTPLDGRQQISGTSLVNLKAALDQLKTAWDTTLVPGVGLTVKAVMDSIQVKGTAR